MDVIRKGHTAPEWSDDPSKPQLLPPTKHFRPNSIRIDFWMPSKGGGITDVRVRLHPADYQSVIKAMLDADPNTTIRAIGAVLADFNPEKGNSK